MSDHSAVLAGFLLARIAEDEVNADTSVVPHAALVQIAPGVQVWQTFGTAMPMNELHGAKGQWVVKTDPVRLRAECHAKRRLVAIAVDFGGTTGDEILRALAAPYAGRRDFPAAAVPAPATPDTSQRANPEHE